ncbi:MAG TPA: cell division protein FtsZ, partial [Streptosporangiaceae bacterium]|nr:cell division protein FtsZ [Streptosporangiaceae bacterium]
TTPGLINLDFADVKSVMSGAGSALMGTGSSRGDDRAVAAAEMAISSPLLEASIDGARGVLLPIQGGSDLGLFEINEAAQLVSNSAAVDANIIFGAVIDDALGDEVRVTVIAAGLDEERAGRAGGGASTAGSGGASYGGASYGGASYGGASYGSASYGSASYGGTGSDRTSSGSASSALSPPATTPGGPGSGAAGAAPGPRRAGDEASGWGFDAGTAAGAGNGVSAAEAPAVPAPAAALAGHVALLSAPVPEAAAGKDGAGPEASAHEPEPDQVASAAAADAAYSSVPRPAHADGPAKAFDVAATLRRPVVFEEDDDLDVPDFLK